MAVRDLSELTMEKVKRAYTDLPESTKEAHRKASMRYNDKMVRQIKFSLNKETDADIIAALDAAPNKQALFKEAMRAYIQNNK